MLWSHTKQHSQHKALGMLLRSTCLKALAYAALLAHTVHCAQISVSSFVIVRRSCHVMMRLCCMCLQLSCSLTANTLSMLNDVIMYNII